MPDASTPDASTPDALTPDALADPTAAEANAAEPTADLGTDPAAPPTRPERVMRAALLFQLAQHQADDLDDLFVVYDAHAGVAGADDPAVDPADLTVLTTAAGWLADPDVADAFFSDVAGQDVERARTTAAFATALLDATAGLTDTRVHRAARASAAWLMAQALHTQQQVEEVEGFLDLAIEANGAYRPALELAAHYASDRGDAPLAISLAKRAGVPESDEWLQMLSSMVPRARPDLGRNDPCYCGSGRKYKQCHLRQTTLGLDERAYWLWRKAVDHLQDSAWQHLLVGVANELLAVEQTTYDSMTYAMTDPVVADIVAFEAGGWDDFLACRGPLLPADELELAQLWATIPRSLFEVTAIDPGRSVTVRNERSGDLLEVRELTYSTTALVGDVVYARVAPAGDTEQFFGGLVPVTAAMHDPLLAALDGPDADPATETLALRPDQPREPSARVRTIARVLRPVLATVTVDGAGIDDDEAQAVDHPHDAGLVTAEGEPLEFIRACAPIPVADLGALVAALDQRPELERLPLEPPTDTEAPASSAAADAIGARPDLPAAFGQETPAQLAALGPVTDRWSAPIELDGQQWLRGTLSLHQAPSGAGPAAATVVVRANSQARYDRFVALLADIAPAITLDAASVDD